MLAASKPVAIAIAAASMKITIVNARTDYKALYSGEYVGRSSPSNPGRSSVLGNPFKIGIHGTREECVEQYERWLREQIRSGNTGILNELARLSSIAYQGKELVLVCWCAPKACHGDVVKRVIEEVLADECTA